MGGAVAFGVGDQRTSCSQPDHGELPGSGAVWLDSAVPETRASPGREIGDSGAVNPLRHRDRASAQVRGRNCGRRLVKTARRREGAQQAETNHLRRLTSMIECRTARIFTAGKSEESWQPRYRLALPGLRNPRRRLSSGPLKSGAPQHCSWQVVPGGRPVLLGVFGGDDLRAFVEIVFESSADVSEASEKSAFRVPDSESSVEASSRLSSFRLRAASAVVSNQVYVHARIRVP